MADGTKLALVAPYEGTYQASAHVPALPESAEAPLQSLFKVLLPSSSLALNTDNKDLGAPVGDQLLLWSGLSHLNDRTAPQLGVLLMAVDGLASLPVTMPDFSAIAHSLHRDDLMVVWCGDFDSAPWDQLKLHIPRYLTPSQAAAVRFVQAEHVMDQLMCHPDTLSAVLFVGPSRKLLMNAVSVRVAGGHHMPAVTLPDGDLLLAAGADVHPASVLVPGLVMQFLRAGFDQAAATLWHAHLKLRERQVFAEGDDVLAPFAKIVTLAEYLELVIQTFGESPHITDLLMRVAPRVSGPQALRVV